MRTYLTLAALAGALFIGLLGGFGWWGTIEADMLILYILCGVVLAFALGLQGLVTNAAAGVALRRKRIRRGDIVELGDAFGWVTGIGICTVVIRSCDGIEHIVASRHFFENGLRQCQYSRERVSVDLPIIDGCDSIQIKEVVANNWDFLVQVLDRPPPIPAVIQRGTNSIELEILVWLRRPTDVTKVKRELILEICGRLDAAGHPLPVLQRVPLSSPTIH